MSNPEDFAINDNSTGAENAIVDLATENDTGTTTTTGAAGLTEARTITTEDMRNTTALLQKLLSKNNRITELMKTVEDLQQSQKVLTAERRATEATRDQLQRAIDVMNAESASSNGIGIVARNYTQSGLSSLQPPQLPIVEAPATVANTAYDAGRYMANVPTTTTAPPILQTAPVCAQNTTPIQSSTASSLGPAAQLQTVPSLSTSAEYMVVMMKSASGEEFGQLVPVVRMYNTNPTAANTAPASSNTPTPPIVQLPPSINGDIQMPQLQYRTRRIHDLPQFDGKPEDWPMFVNSFRETTRDDQLTDLDNQQRLIKALSGDALKVVQSLLAHTHLVEEVVATLETTFGNPDILVDSQIEVARKLPVIFEDHLERIIAFAIAVKNLVAFLDDPATEHRLADPTLMKQLLSKLPLGRRVDWFRSVSKMERRPTIKDFSGWVSELAGFVQQATLEPPSFLPTRQSASAGRTAAERRPFSKPGPILLNVETNRSPVVVCENCGRKGHTIGRCYAFLSLSPRERLRIADRRRLCYGCLSTGHILPGCGRRQQCGVDGCEMWHAQALHRTLPIEDDEPSRSIGDRPNDEPVHSADPNSVLSCQKSSERTNILFRVVPVILHGPNTDIETFALLDSASSYTLIDAEIADQLQLDGPTSAVETTSFTPETSRYRSKTVSLGISGSHANGQRFELDSAHTIDHLSLPVQSVDIDALSTIRPYLRDTPIAGYRNGDPKILIGLDNHHLGIALETRISDDQLGLVAENTKLGWIVYGLDSSTLKSAQHVLHTYDGDRQYDELNELVRNYYETENFGVILPSLAIESDAVTRARRLLSETTRRVDGRFETGLLWAKDDIHLPPSYDMALQRLTQIEAKMRRSPEYGASYTQQINAYIAKGYARMLSAEEAERQSSRTWYIPHFAVTNPNKPGKVRLVFDAAAKVRSVSLNSVLLSGPDMNVPLVRLLMQFRIGSVGVCADIREMFHQVRMIKEDQDSQRFLWRGGEQSRVPDIYVMTVMTFGATCSPASAQHVKNVNADEHEAEFPDAAELIRTRHYVDDFVASFNTPDEAVRISAEVVELHRRGGFELRGFVSNSAVVMSALGSTTGPGSSEVHLQPVADDTTEKVLGMYWETSQDAFVFRTRFSRIRPDVITGRRRPTRREMLAVVMSVYDPFGLLCDFTLPAKIALQDMWRFEIGWDDTVPEHIDERWQAWRSALDQTQKVSVPRCYSKHITSSADIQLHVFADASEVAYAAVAYWRVQFDDGVDVAFVAGKARIAPMKTLSIPRLELQAALLATRLMSEVREGHGLCVSKTIMWSDSETVLSWLRSDQRKYKQFVAFRVAEVVETAPASIWRWVPTALNVADDSTRSTCQPAIEADSRWLRGPAWLKSPENEWPEQKTIDMVETCPEEVRSKFVGHVCGNAFIDFERFEKYGKLCRMVARILRFVSNARKTRGERSMGGLEANEVDEAKLTICRLVQRTCFWREYAAISAGKPIDASSPLFALSPYLDDAKTMRLGGRTDKAQDEFMDAAARRPILLPRNHYFATLVVRHYHERMAHQLVNATIAAVRQTFWIPNVRGLVQQVQRECVTCRIRAAKPRPPVQGQLPSDRLTPYLRPFHSTGLDYFGPVDVTVGRRREKRWVALFTCMATRAVHLEIAADLSTDSCLLCIRNLCHIRGVPARIRCDNGTNFVGASNELRTAGNFFDPEVIRAELSVDNISWRFNCPGNPEAGGAWERMVQSVKRLLSHTLRSEAPRVETLRAHLLEVANMLNSRPLTHVPVDHREQEVLTPNHFLMGGPNAVTMADPDIAESKCMRVQWRIGRELSRRFWMRWINEYLPELTRRSKAYPERPSLKVDDMVLVCDANIPRGRWPMARVTGVTKGSDGVVRQAEVKTAKGVYRRPVARLAIIDFDQPSSTVSADGARPVASPRTTPSDEQCSN